MAIIKADGLFGGDRLRECSELARLWWPWFYVAGNGYGRIEVNYGRIVREMFGAWDVPPLSKDDLRDIFKEYHKHHLAYVYQADGKIWAQFEVMYKPKHYTAEDRRSPEPPAEIEKWREQYRLHKEAKALNDLDGWEIIHAIDNKGDGQTRTSSGKSGENAAIGIGIGIGIGKGKKQKPSAHSRSQADPRFTPVRESIEKYWNFKNAVPMPWDGGEAKQLKRLLEATPTLSVAQVQLCLQHRARSDVAHTERPRKWLENLLTYANGPLDKFGKPKGTDGTGTSNAEKRQQRIIENTRKAFDAIAGGADWDANDVRRDDGGNNRALCEGVIEVPGDRSGSGD